MQRESIRSALIDLLRSGALEVRNGEMFLYDEPVSDNTSDAAEAFLPNGWSVETSNGCRRHRAIDEFIERLARGDEFERRVADEADVWFCFSPTECEDMLPDDATEREQVENAYYNSRFLARWLGLGTSVDNAVDFRLRADKWNEGADSYWFMPALHQTVYAMNPESEAPERWPDQHISNLKARVEYYRSGQDKRDEEWAG